MKNIIMLTSNRTGRGTYWRAKGFAEELVLKGYHVTLLSIGTHHFQIKEYNSQGVNIVETPDIFPTSGYDPWDTIRRIFWLREKRYHLIHAFESRPVTIFPALWLMRRDTTPLIMDWCDWFGRGGSVEQRSNRLIRTILRPIETYFEERFRTVANGTTIINSILKQKAKDLGVDSESIHYLPNGANVKSIVPKNLKHVRHELGLPVDTPILGYTGAMFQQDGALMAKTFELIYQKQPNVRLLLIGYNNIKIEEQLTSAKKAVIRTGHVSYSQLTNYLAACNIGWLTLKNNGANQGRFPMKAFDFMAAARPLIVTDVADLGYMVREKKVGLVSKDTPDELANTTLELLNDIEQQTILGHHGRKLVVDEFASNIVATKLDNFYQEIMAGTPI